MSSPRRSDSSSSLVLIAAVTAAAAGLLCVAPARAVDIPLDNYSLEVQHRSSTGAYAASQAQPATGMRLGFQSGFGGPDSGNGYGGIDSILYFKLPAIPAGQQVSTASLSLSLLASSSGSQPAFNVDLYGLGFDKNSPPSDDGASTGFGVGGVTSAVVAPAYFYVGPGQVGGSAAVSNNVAFTKLQEDVLVPDDWTAANASATSEVVRQTSADGNAALLSFIQSVYANPGFTPDHDYLVLRMNPDIQPTSTSTSRYQIPFAQTPSTPGATSATATVPTLSVTFAASHFPGDTNNDGVVDLTDLNNVLNNFGSTGANAGDDNSDGTVDLTDLNNVLNNFGSTNAAAAAALSTVPEPASLGLLAIGVPALLARRRRRRRCRCRHV